jgi:hypothetical protein
MIKLMQDPGGLCPDMLALAPAASSDWKILRLPQY